MPVKYLALLWGGPDGALSNWEFHIGIVSDIHDI